MPSKAAKSASPAVIDGVRVAAQLEAFDANTAELTLNLPDGSAVRVNRAQSDVRKATDFTWFGGVPDDPDQQVVLTRVGAHLSGYLSLSHGAYELTPSAQGTLLMKLDAARFPECGGGVAVEPPGSGDAPSAAMPTGGDANIDVLVVFSPGTTTQLGGQAQAQAFAQGSVDSANQAFINSQMEARLRLAGVRFTARVDSGSSSTDLSWLRADPQVIAWRNEVGADMVSMISEFSNSCGQGYLMGNPPGLGFAPNAFQVSARSCAIGNLSYAHEHGHNMGFQHNPEDGSGPAFPYAFGHYINGNYRTVMSYATPCTSGCTRRPYFSNPNVSFQGAATGVTNQRDNARAGNQTAAIVAQFRASLDTMFANGFE